MDESYIVELLADGRPARPGEIGEVVITDLNNFSVPLIRYRIGDLAVAVDGSEPCACGRHLSGSAASRAGRRRSSTAPTAPGCPARSSLHFFKDYEYAIRHFQVRQDDGRRVHAQDREEPAVHRRRRSTEILDELRGYAGARREIDVEFVDEIPLVRTGKRSPVVSTVREDFQSLGSRTAPSDVR